MGMRTCWSSRGRRAGAGCSLGGKPQGFRVRPCSQAAICGIQPMLTLAQQCTCVCRLCLHHLPLTCHFARAFCGCVQAKDAERSERKRSREGGDKEGGGGGGGESSGDDERREKKKKHKKEKKSRSVGGGKLFVCALAGVQCVTWTWVGAA